MAEMLKKWRSLGVVMIVLAAVVALGMYGGGQLWSNVYAEGRAMVVPTDGNGAQPGTIVSPGTGTGKVMPAALSGSGAAGQVTFWTGTESLSGDNDLYWDNTNKRLGIGTASPARKLHYYGDAALFQRSVDAAGFIIQRTDTNRWVFGASENPSLGTGFSIYTYPVGAGSATSRLFLDLDGRVGIGTTSPLSQAKLHVVSTDTAGHARAVYGETTAASGNTKGVYGTHTASGNYGYLGGSEYGVYGDSSGGGYGVFGNGVSSGGVWGASVDGTGVYGQSTNHHGVYGWNTDSGNYGYLGSDEHGVYGEHEDSDNYGYLGGSQYGAYGIYGWSGPYGYLGSSQYGVYGEHADSNNFGYLGGSDQGVGGYSSSGKAVNGYSDSGEGGYFTSNSNTGARGTSNSGAGVWGESDSAVGVCGFSGIEFPGYTNGTGVWGQGSSYGVYGVSDSGVGVYGQSNTGKAGHFWGDVQVTGKLGILEGGTIPTYSTLFQGGDQSADITYTLPTSDGDPDQVLTTNGAGVLSWTTSGGSLPSGSSGQTLRYNDSNWVANDLLYNNGTTIGIGTTSPDSLAKLHVVNTDTTTNARAVYGETTASSTTYGVYGKHTDSGNLGYLGDTNVGAYGINAGTGQWGALGTANAGVEGSDTTGNCGGWLGTPTQGVYGFAPFPGSGPPNGPWAGHFGGDVWVQGNMWVQGSITKGGGGFKIDHPLDPENKYLQHSFVESPDMKNVYDGNIVLDENGEAVVELPAYFEALNRDFRYQLTAIGTPGPNLYIAQKISGNQFKIAGGSAGMEVSWQVTGIRHDDYADANRIQVEVEKPEK